MKEPLITAAKAAMANAYAPYSGFYVGAALLCADGSIYTGCNVENAAYGATNCAERTAFFKAVSDGKRAFTAMAICGGPQGELTDEVCAPCGICRQVMREFCDDAFEVYLVTANGVRTVTSGELLPLAFGPHNLPKTH